ncbi:MAG TPA: hypothetical protein VG273_20305, partial [Bryobacteraceae bacterium]|nr:hypothetical protein [Bryobacteraceae bacterium]
TSLALAHPALANDDDANSSILPVQPTETDRTQVSVQWQSLIRQSLFFLGVEHGFRLVTDPQTREFGGGAFFSGYFNSVGNLHGWADGDPFVVNYVGHPMQGAVSGFIWMHNDPRYRTAEFGRDRRYWTGKVRAMAFAWAYSEQFEIGPVSEASIGHVQAYYPQQGFVDHVITPTVGMGWMIAEDAIDRYVIRRIESRFSNRWLRIAARGFLNPSRTFANCMEMEAPWHRENRPGITHSFIAAEPRPRSTRAKVEDGPIQPALFEFSASSSEMLLGAGKQNMNCVGGTGTALINLNPALAVETEVGGCKMLGPGLNLSGDATTFAVGPRYTYRTGGHWTPWAHVLLGGEKLTQELLMPDVKAAVMATAAPGTAEWTLHDAYTRHYEATGFTVNFGSGVDWTMNRTVAFRVGSVEYIHSWMPRLNDQSFNHDVRITAGFTLRAGG